MQHTTEAMGMGLGRKRSNRAEPKVSEAAGLVRARCPLHVVLSVAVCWRFPTCPSISSGAPLEGLGSNPGVEDLPLHVGPGDHRRHRERRHRRRRRRTVAPQCGLCWGPFGGARVGSLAGSHVLFFWVPDAHFGAFAACGGCRDRWMHFRRVVFPFMLSDSRANVNLHVEAREVPPTVLEHESSDM